MFKLQSLSKYSPFDAIHLSRCFSTSRNSFWTRWFWCLLVLLPFFVSPLPHWQNVSLWGLFSSRKTKKIVTWGKIGWIQRVRHGGHAIFCQKWLNTQHSVGRCARKSPIMKWANTLKESSKKFTEAQTSASHNNASWYTDTDGFLDLSPSRGSLYYKGPTLQKIIPFWGSPS